SLRYIAKLATLLDVAEDCGQLDHRVSVMIPPPPIARTSDERVEVSVRQIRDRVVQERGPLLQALKHAIVQAKSHLLNGLPAAQLEGWCKGVLRDVFRFSVDSNQRALDLSECRLMTSLYNRQASDTAEFIFDA